MKKIIKGDSKEMPRRPRIDFAGFYHIINRGVNRTNIYLCSDDKHKFL